MIAIQQKLPGGVLDTLVFHEEDAPKIPEHIKSNVCLVFPDIPEAWCDDSFMLESAIEAAREAGKFKTISF